MWGACTLPWRRHDDADLVLWCRHGALEVELDDSPSPPGHGTGSAGQVLRIGTGSAVLVPAGRSHRVRTAPGALVQPVFLPRLPLDLSRARVISIDGGALARALVELAVADSTELAPMASVVSRLRAGVRSAFLQPGSPVLDGSATGRAHIGWVRNPTHEAVVLLAVHGPLTVMLRSAAGAGVRVPLREHMAVSIPGGMDHQVIGRGGSALPAFLPRLGGERPRLMYLPESVRRHVTQQFVADTSALTPLGWDARDLATQLDAALQTSELHGMEPQGRDGADGQASPSETVRRLLCAVIADPATALCPAALAGSGEIAGPTRRTIERGVRDAVGSSFVTWRNAARAEQAEDMLRAGAPVKAVGRRMGFAHASGFSRAFRRSAGRAPSEARSSITAGG